jgi:hypothetical protein
MSRIPSIARAVERHARRNGHPVELDAFLGLVCAVHEVDRRTARAGLRLAEIGERVHVHEGLDGAWYVIAAERGGQS